MVSESEMITPPDVRAGQMHPDAKGTIKTMCICATPPQHGVSRHGVSRRAVDIPLAGNDAPRTCQVQELNEVQP